MQAPEPSPPALCAFIADLLKTVKIAQKNLPKGIFGSYSAVLDSIPFSMSSGKGGMAVPLLPHPQRSLLPAPHTQQDWCVHAIPCFHAKSRGILLPS